MGVKLHLWNCFFVLLQLPSKTNELKARREAGPVRRPALLLLLLSAFLLLLLLFSLAVVAIVIVAVDYILPLLLCTSCLITGALNARADACVALLTGNVMAWKMSLAVCLWRKLGPYIA